MIGTKPTYNPEDPLDLFNQPVPKQPVDFYKSTSQTDEERMREQVRANSQTIDVWELLKDGKKRTTIMIRMELEQIHQKRYNLNSVRRATRDLMKKWNLIQKMEETQFEEESGGYNHFYKSIKRHGNNNTNDPASAGEGKT